MLKVGIIGYGAIAQYVIQALPTINAQLDLVIARSGRFDVARAALGNAVMQFTIVGKTIPGNARTSALAAMSVVKMLSDHSQSVIF